MTPMKAFLIMTAFSMATAVLYRQMGPAAAIVPGFHALYWAIRAALFAAERGE